MQLSIQGHQLQITEALKNYIGEKFKRLEHLLGGPMNVHLDLESEQANQKAIATIQIYGASLFAEEIKEDLYSAIDGLVDKLDRQIMTYKTNNAGH